MTHLLRRPAVVPSLFARAAADAEPQAPSPPWRDAGAGRAALPLVLLLAELPILKGATAILGVALSH